jgi:hypothetical protein
VKAQAIASLIGTVVGLAIGVACSGTPVEAQAPERFQEAFRGRTGGQGRGVVTLLDTQTGACWISWSSGIAPAPKEVCE